MAVLLACLGLLRVRHCRRCFEEAGLSPDEVDPVEKARPLLIAFAVYSLAGLAMLLHNQRA